MRLSPAWLLLGLLAVGCPGRSRPAGPPPEYEKPVLPPWDAGTSTDPLDQVEGEEVTDDPEPPKPDSGGADANADAGS